MCVCGSLVASTPEVSGRNMYFAFPVLSLATDVVFELASLGTYHVNPAQRKCSPDQVSDSRRWRFLATRCSQSCCGARLEAARPSR